MRRSFARRPGGSGYKPPAVDGARAKANASMFLTGIRSLDRVTIDSLARDYRLKPTTAARMLSEERDRRARLC